MFSQGKEQEPASTGYFSQVVEGHGIKSPCPLFSHFLWEWTESCRCWEQQHNATGGDMPGKHAYMIESKLEKNKGKPKVDSTVQFLFDT